MTLALTTVVSSPRRAFGVPLPRVAEEANRLTHAEPAPATQRTVTHATTGIVEEWGRQCFAASGPPTNW